MQSGSYGDNIKHYIPECDHIQFGISIDIVVWTPSENEFHLIRVGDGENRRVREQLA